MSSSSSSPEVVGHSSQLNEHQGGTTWTTKPRSKLARWYRSPLFNVILVGLISFTQPGIWNALNSVGAGGQQEPYLVNAANSLTYGLMVFLCFVFGALANKIGVKWVLVIGTLGYAPYSASLYVNNRYGVEWFVIFGGATCGVAAAALWSSEAAIALGYGRVEERGKFTGLWLGLRELGQLIGASIQLAYNVNDQNAGKVAYSTYFALIALQCLGLPLALLVSPPHKVVRPSTGERLADPPTTSAKNRKPTLGELRKIWALLQRREVLLLIPILVGFQWNSVYIGIYLTKYFSVRARTLASLTSGVVASVANVFWGFFFDLKRFRRPTLAKITWSFFVVIMLALLSWQVSNEKLYEQTQPSLDWVRPGFGRGFASMVLFRFFNESHYMFTYWLVGAFFDDLETLSLAVGLIRSIESLGYCVAYGIGASNVSPMVNLVVAFAMFGLTIPATSRLIFLVPERPVTDAVAHVVDGDDGDGVVVDDPGFVSKAVTAADAPHA